MNCEKFPDTHSRMGTFPHSQVLFALLLLLALPASLMAAAPVVDSVSASSTVAAPGEVVSLQVDAHDPDCADTCSGGGFGSCGLSINASLTSWSAPAGTFSNQDNGITSSPYTGTVDYQAPPNDGTYTVTVEIADNDGGSLCFGERSYATATIDILVTSITTQPPVVDELTVDRAQMYPTESAELFCSGSDPDGEAITYSWSASLGTVTPGAGGEATYDGGDPGIVTITCTVTDPNGASGSANVSVSVSDAFPERQLTKELITPQRVALDDSGKVYVVDPAAGGIAVVDLTSGEAIDFLALPGVTSVAVDWAGDLVVGSRGGARLLNSAGTELLELETGRGFVSDVAVDAIRQRYAVLHRDSGRVAVYDAAGGFYAGFGQSGDGAAQLERPMGLAFTPEGRIAVADSGHGLVKVFTIAGELLSSFGGLGGGAGSYVQLGDVEVDGDGILYTTDGYQDWVQTWNPGGTPRETLGTYGEDLGQLKTPAGIAVSGDHRKLLVASLNGSRVEVFALAPAAHVPAPEALLSGNAIVFGDQPVETTSSFRTLDLSNGGDAPLTLQSVTAGGDFTASHGCAATIEPGSSCVLSVAFRPATTGLRSASMRVTTSAGVFDVALSGHGVNPATATLSDFALSFPRQVVGTMSASQTVTLTNYGTEVLAVSGIQAGAHFGTLTNCGSLLPGATTCTIDVYFTPAASGDPLFATLMIYTSAGTRAVSLSGLAVTLEVTLSPLAVDFGSVAAGTSSLPRTVTVTNTGDEALTFAGLGISGSDPGEFVLTSDGCSYLVLPAGSSCAFDVAYSPTVEAAATAEVTLVTDAPTTGVVTLAGIGEPTIFIDGFESGDVSAWSNAVGTQQLVVMGDLLTGESTVQVLSWRNRLARPVTIELLTLLGEGSENLVIDDGCSGNLLKPGARCEVKVTFAPWREGETLLRLVLPSDPPRALEPADTVLYGEARAIDSSEEK